MDLRKKSCYLGINLNDTVAMVSYYQLNMKEPETVSTIAGSDHFQIPVLLAKRKNLGQWYYGDEARRMAKSCEMVCIDALLRRAVNKESIRIEDETYAAVDLLTLFFRKIIDLAMKAGTFSEVTKGNDQQNRTENGKKRCYQHTCFHANLLGR